MVRPHFQREGAEHFKNQNISFNKYSQKKTKILQQEGTHPDTCLGGENGRQTHTRSTTRDIRFLDIKEWIGLTKCAPEWLLIGTCGGSFRANLHREDDTFG